MKLTDNKKTVEITMHHNWIDGEGYTPDWSEDFFCSGNLNYDEDRDAYIVKDVDYCVDQANDWMHSTGDFSMDESNEDRMVFVDEIEGEEPTAKVYGNEKTSLKLSALALDVYSNTDPLKIIEESDGTYTMTGCFEQTGMSADDVNSFLEELGSEDVDTF